MTAKELIEHLKDAAPNGDVLLLYRDSQGDRDTYVYELAAVRATVDMDSGGMRHTTYLVAGDEMEED